MSEAANGANARSAPQPTGTSVGGKLVYEYVSPAKLEGKRDNEAMFSNSMRFSIDILARCCTAECSKSHSMQRQCRSAHFTQLVFWRGGVHN